MPRAKTVTQGSSIDSCKQMTDLILSYLNNRLRPALRREFEQHLRICPDCVHFLNTYKKTVAIAGTLKASEISEPVPAMCFLSYARRRPPSQRFCSLGFFKRRRDHGHAGEPIVGSNGK